MTHSFSDEIRNKEVADVSRVQYVCMSRLLSHTQLEGFNGLEATRLHTIALFISEAGGRRQRDFQQEDSVSAQK